MRKILYTMLLLVSFIQADTLYKDIYQTVMQWNQANNDKNLRSLSALYDRSVLYHSTKMNRKQLLLAKKRLFAQYPHSKQTLRNFKYSNLSPKLYKVTFDKFIQLREDAPSKRHSTYLVIDTSSLMPLIIEEGDNRAVDREHFNVDRKHKKLKRYYLNQSATFIGTIELRKGYNAHRHRDHREAAYILKLQKPIKIVRENTHHGHRKQAMITDEIELSSHNLKLLKVARQHNLRVRITGELDVHHSREEGRKVMMKTQSICISSDLN